MEPFGEEHAKVYDSQFDRLATARDAVHLGARLALSSLPDSARVLCVGAGTGEDAIKLAAPNRGWSFQLVDPAPAMLRVARERLKAAGILERCAIHDGFLQSLPETAPFDGATALLVSHFLTDLKARTDFFRDIAGRLSPGCPLVFADLAADREAPGFDDLMGAWLNALRLCDMPEENVAAYREAFGRDFAAHTPAELERAVEVAGFEPPVLIFQPLLIRVYMTRAR
ncbi:MULTISPECIES: class I SAM-dependent methyltransferase [Henriciella]|uniref:class I SAM-dependent methyltransferase n=1 Tax=Henriciella TaxID=453849 RepID=UPI00351197DE